MRKYNLYTDEERPLIELPALLIIIIISISLIFALSLLLLSPVIVLLVFIAFCIGIAIVFNPFAAIPVFIVGGYLHPVAFFPQLASYHPTTIFAVCVLLAWAFHIMLYRDFETVKSKQVLYMIFFSLTAAISSFFHWEYSGYPFIDFVKILILYFIVVHLIDTRLRVSVLISLLIPLGVLVAGYALYLQSRGVGRGFIEGAMRVVSFEGNPNYLSLSLAMLVPLIFAMYIVLKSKIVRGILIISFLLFSLVIIMTYSRSGFLGFVVILMLAVWKFFAKKNKMMFSILISALTLIFFNYAPPQFYERIYSIINLQEPSIVGRLDVYRVGFKIILKHPFLGVGLGLDSFQKEYFDIAITMPQITNKIMGWTHNLFLEIGSKLGVPALIFFITAIFYALKDLRESRKIFFKKKDKFLFRTTQAVEVSIIGYLVFAMFITSLVLKIFWILLGMTAALRQIAINHEENVPPETS